MLRRIFSMLMAVISCILSLVGWNGMIQVEDAHYEMVDQALINPNADESAKALYRFLLEIDVVLPTNSKAATVTRTSSFSRRMSFRRCTALQTHIRR